MRSGTYRLIIGALASIVLTHATGCQTSARTLSVRVQAPDKDVLVCLVEVDRPLAPEQYLEWTKADLAVQGQDPGNPFWPQPIYELFYSFHLNKKLLATVHYRRPENHPETEDLVHVRTQVYEPLD